MSNLLKKTDGKLTRDQQARRYALVMYHWCRANAI